MMMHPATRRARADKRAAQANAAAPRHCGVLVALALLLALAGCASTTGPSDSAADGSDSDASATEPSDAAPLRGEGIVEHRVDNRAVALLWNEAEQARREGNLEAAVASLERAVRVAPDDPVLWSRLAELRLRQQEFAVAENLAAKSNALAGDQQLLRYRNWLIVAEARKRRGDEEGAKEARAEARRLSGGARAQ